MKVVLRLLVPFPKLVLQMAVFHALGLAPIRQPVGTMLPVPRDLRRVVLLVPKSGLSLLRAFTQPELYLALSGTLEPFENFFVSVHTVFVRVRRGSKYRGQEDIDVWRSLNSHLMVRDTWEQDPEAELMVRTCRNYTRAAVFLFHTAIVNIRDLCHER